MKHFTRGTETPSHRAHVRLIPHAGGTATGEGDSSFRKSENPTPSPRHGEKEPATGGGPSPTRAPGLAQDLVKGMAGAKGTIKVGLAATPREDIQNLMFSEVLRPRGALEVQ